MSFRLECPKCGSAITATTELVGRLVACPHCAAHFAIPAEGKQPVHRQPIREKFSYEAVRFSFTCRRCESILEGGSDMCGQPGRCPTCGATFTVPAVDRKTGLVREAAVIEEEGNDPTPVHAYAAAGDKAPVIRRSDDGEPYIVCPRCGARMAVEADLCSACGIPFTIEGASTISKRSTLAAGNGLAIAALSVGLLSLPLFKIGIALGPVAVGLGFAAAQRAQAAGPTRPGFIPALIGLACGIVSLTIFVFVYWL